VAAWGSNTQTGLYGIFYGDWSTGNLVMTRATINGLNPALMLLTSEASCDGDRRFLYAISGAADDGLLAVLTSSDGGVTWNFIANPLVKGKTVNLYSRNPDIAGNQQGYNNCVAVCATDSQRVAIGFRGGPFISTDGGQTWAAYSDQTSSHIHSDLHAVYFDPFQNPTQHLFVGSDGGVVHTPDLGTTFISNLNRQMRNLQFARADYLAFSPSYAAPDLVAGGLQDNGNVYTLIDGNQTPWKELDNSDGQLALFLSTGNLLYGNNVRPMVRNATWNGNVLSGGPAVPVTVGDPTLPPLTSGLFDPVDTGNFYRQTVVEIVITPKFRRGGELMYAAAGLISGVYGLFANPDGGNIQWVFLGAVPITVKVNADSDYITAVGSLDGSTIFVGTAKGRIFAFDSKQGSALELNVLLSADAPGGIHRFAVQSATGAFAILNRGGNGYILRLNTLRWEPLAGGLPNESFFGLEVDWTADPKTLFAVTDSRVYASRDNGDTWQSESQGLPRRPHCSDLRFVTKPTGGHYLYSSTYGRSLFRARVNPPTPPAVGNSALLESPFRSDTSKPGNFELLVLGGNNLVHYWRNNSDPALAWHPGVTFSSAASGPASVIESGYRSDASKPGNFELLVPESNNLVHYWRDNSDPALPWHRGPTVSTAVSGPACMIGSSYRADSSRPGNFEALVLEGTNLVHYWRDNSDPAQPWHKGVVVSPVATGQAYLLEGPYRADASKPGNFEALILEGTILSHFWRDNSDPAQPWHKGVIVSRAATAPACMIESSFRADANKPGNFEALVPEGNNLIHYWRDNSDPAQPWHRGVVVSSLATGSACLIESPFRADASKPGNFEAVVPEGNNLVHYWRDNSDPALPWNRGVVVVSEQ
jgi:hypothetical protein